MNSHSIPRILVVDDEKHIREAVSSWFNRRGFFVRVAENGARAVAICEEEEFDVMVIDMEMPVMNGPEAIKKIRSIAPEMPILVFTGFSASIQEAIDVGANQILHKPVSLHDLEEEVRKCLGES